MFKSAFVAGIVLATLVPGLVSAAGRNEHRGYNAEYNHASYWGEDCKKFESPNNKKVWSTSRDDTLKVIVKGGTEVKIYTEGPFVDLAAATNDRSGKPYDISHVIECYGEQTVEVCEYNPQLPVGDPSCKPDEVPDPCEYDSSLEADDPSCKQPTDEPEEPGQTLGETNGKGGDQPEILAETGIGAIPSILVGIMFASTAAVVTSLAADDDDFINTL